MQEGVRYMMAKVQKRLEMEPSEDVRDYIDAYLLEKQKHEKAGDTDTFSGAYVCTLYSCSLIENSVILYLERTFCEQLHTAENNWTRVLENIITSICNIVSNSFDPPISAANQLARMAWEFFAAGERSAANKLCCRARRRIQLIKCIE